MWSFLFFFLPFVGFGLLPLFISASWSADFQHSVRLASGIAPFLLVLVALLLGFFGLLPGTRRPVKIRVRIGPASAINYEAVEAIRIRGGGYRILSISTKPGHEIPEFSAGDIVRCIEASMPDGTRALLAVERINRIVN